MSKKFNAKKFKPTVGPKFTNITQGKYRYYYLRFDGSFTREEMIQFCNMKSKKLNEARPNANHFKITTRWSNGDWRSGATTKPGEPVSIFQPYGDRDYGEIVGFDVMMSIAD